MLASKIGTTDRFTYADYLLWDDGQRWELIDGNAYNMSPAPFRKHQEISGRIHNFFFNFLKDKPCKIYAAPFDVRFLPENADKKNIDNIDYNAIDTVVQPDLTIVCDSSKLDKRGCIGSPDLIIEITSRSTINKDVKEKFALYEKQKVKEYWLVFPDSRTVSIFKYALGSFGKPEMYANDDVIASTMFPGLSINLAEVFTDTDDE